MKIDYNYKVWLEIDGKPLLGKGRYQLLKKINNVSSLKKSADQVGIANKTAYNHIKKIEEGLGKKIIKSYKGGVKAGGYTKLTLLGLRLIKKFEETNSKIKQ